MNAEKCCIVCYGVGGWYPQGVKRLERSLILNGWAGGMIMMDKNTDNFPSHLENPYACKIYAIEKALNLGYTHILWLDASIWAVRDPMPIFDHIAERGYYFFKTGYNLAQSCSDRILNYAGVTRDQSEQMTEGATGCVGLNFDNEKGIEFFKLWKKYMLDGMFRGSRFHDNQSKDSRFLFHRQDQSAAGLIINKLGMKVSDAGGFIAYTEHKKFYGTEIDNDKLLFYIRGM